MNSIEPTSTPRVGCAATNSRSSRLSSRASTTFCWLPPDSRPGGGRRCRGRAHVELAPRRLAGELVAVRRSRCRRTTGERAREAAVEHQVLGDRELGDQPVLLAVFGHEADAGVEHVAHRGADEFAAAELDRAEDAGAQAEDRLGELGLTVALHPGDGEDLARADLEADVVEQTDAAGVEHGEALDHERDLARLGGALSTVSSTSRPTISDGELAGRRGRRRRCRPPCRGG